MDHVIEPWMIALSIIKGVLVAAIIIGIIGPSFLEALAVASCSAFITGIFLIISTHMQTMKVKAETEKNREKIEQVATKIESSENG